MKKTNVVIIKLIGWIVFSVCFAMLPFLFNLINDFSRGIDVTLVSLFGDGQLLLVSTTLCAVAVGELFGVASTKSIATHLLGGLTIILIAITSFYYANVSTGDESLRHDIVANLSLWSFIASVFISSLIITIVGIKEG
jgi:hypothetical protein